MKWLAIPVLILLSLPAPMLAQDQNSARYCAERAPIIDGLLARFGERIRATFVGKDGQDYLLLASASSGNWTLLRDGSGGLVCLVATGIGWRSADVSL